MRLTSGQIAEAVGARLIGPRDVEISGVASIESATAADLVFVDSEKHFEEALASAAGAIIADDFAASLSNDRALLISDHPKLAFARAAQLLRERTSDSAGIHSSAVVHASAKIGADVRVGA